MTAFQVKLCNKSVVIIILGYVISLISKLCHFGDLETSFAGRRTSNFYEVAKLNKKNTTATRKCKEGVSP